MEKPTGALYLRCSAGHALAAWLAIGLHVGCGLTFAVWLATHVELLRPAWLVLPVAGVVGLLGADLFSGAIHWLSDTWFDELTFDRLACIIREHHVYPEHLHDYGFRDHVGYMSLPTVLLFGPVCALLTLLLPPSGFVGFAVLVSAEVCALTFFGTYFHRLGHVRPTGRLVRLLQTAGLLITPREHALHHRGQHITHYCVVTGWMNPLLDATGFWRALEKAISALTGAVPRQNESEWLVRFREDPSFMLDPIPSLVELRRRRSTETEETGR